MKLETLYKRDKTGKKVLSCEIEVDGTDKDIDTGKELTIFSRVAYNVIRLTGFIDGKKQKHVDLVTDGKQTRTVYEQAVLEAKSHWNSKRDEGYKTFEEIQAQSAISYDKSLYNLQAWLIKALPEDRTDASGVLKPMKCTATNDTKTGRLLKNVIAKIQYPCDVQTKLDGVRCFATNYEDGFRFTSSSGKPYDIVCQHIKKELDALKLPVGIILDGELYEHGTPLEKISGWCRTTTRRIPEHDRMIFHIFDMPGIATWWDRRNQLYSLFELIQSRDIDTPHIKHVPSYIAETFEDVQRYHDDFVEEGYEGAIIRNRRGKYAFGIRSSEIFKMKNFQDDEFKIVGYELGKRGSFDMVFNCITKDGKPFSAKPLGDAVEKENYVKEFDLYIKGHFGTVRYLNYSSYGIPVGNPVLKTIRDYE